MTAWRVHSVIVRYVLIRGVPPVNAILLDSGSLRKTWGDDILVNCDPTVPLGFCPEITRLDQVAGFEAH